MAFQGDSIFWVEVEKVVPNPFQPRREFDEQKLKELSESVRMYGILQPLTVTRREVQAEDGSFRSEYELIAGERRLRASKLAGLLQVPVIIREGEQSEQEKLELAIIENLQREDLNSVDRALAFRQLADVFGLSHSQVATKVGRSREYVSNSIRLLALPDYMLNALRTGDMSEGHGRTLLMLNDRPEEQDTVFREILLKKLSVREVERIARSIASEKIRKVGNFDADLVELEKKFTETLGTRVSIVKTEFGGRLSIDYFTAADLEQILERMKIEAGRAAYTIGVHVDTSPVVTALGEPLEQSLADPRADELMILTDSTGLELVANDTPADLTVSASEDVFVPEAEIELATETELEAKTETSLETENEPESAPPTVTESPNPVLDAPVPPPPVPEPALTPAESQPAPGVEPVTSSAHRPSSAPELETPTPTSLPVSELNHPVEPPPAAPVLPAVPEVAPRLSLRDQLAQLLRQTAKPGAATAATAAVANVSGIQSAAPDIPTVAEAVVQAAAPEVPAALKVSEASPAPEKKPETEDDDDNLYDLKSFSI